MQGWRRIQRFNSNICVVDFTILKCFGIMLLIQFPFSFISVTLRWKEELSTLHCLLFSHSYERLTRKTECLLSVSGNYLNTNTFTCIFSCFHSQLEKLVNENNINIINLNLHRQFMVHMRQIVIDGCYRCRCNIFMVCMALEQDAPDAF